MFFSDSIKTLEELNKRIDSLKLSSDNIEKAKMTAEYNADLFYHTSTAVLIKMQLDTKYNYTCAELLKNFNSDRGTDVNIDQLDEFLEQISFCKSTFHAYKKIMNQYKIRFFGVKIDIEKSELNILEEIRNFWLRFSIIRKKVAKEIVEYGVMYQLATEIEGMQSYYADVEVM